MSGLRKLRRQAGKEKAIGTVAPVAPNQSYAGRHNAYFCPKCRALTIVRHRDDGVTPMFLICRALGEGVCDGRASSLMYPPENFFAMLGVDRDVPETYRVDVLWEWFAENDKQRRREEVLSLRRAA